jgi:hypothetical protein
VPLKRVGEEMFPVISEPPFFSLFIPFYYITNLSSTDKSCEKISEGSFYIKKITKHNIPSMKAFIN